MESTYLNSERPVFETEENAFRNILSELEGLEGLELNESKITLFRSKILKFWHLHQVKMLMFLNWRTIAIEGLIIEKNSNKIIDMIDDLFWRIPELSSDEIEKGKYSNSQFKTEEFSKLEKLISQINTTPQEDYLVKKVEEYDINVKKISKKDLTINKLKAHLKRKKLDTEQKEKIKDLLKSANKISDEILFENSKKLQVDADFLFRDKLRDKLKSKQHLEHTIPRALIKLYIEYKCISFYKISPSQPKNFQENRTSLTKFQSLVNVFRNKNISSIDLGATGIKSFREQIPQDIAERILPLNICCAMTKTESKEYEKNYLNLNYGNDQTISVSFDYKKPSSGLGISLVGGGKTFRQKFEDELSKKRKEVIKSIPFFNEFTNHEDIPIETVASEVLSIIFDQLWLTPLMRYPEEIKVFKIESDGNEFYNNNSEWSKDEIMKIHNLNEYNGNNT